MRATSLWLVLLLVLTGCATGRASRASRIEGSALSGEASWYGHPYHGRRTASGEIYDMNKLTAAHPTLPVRKMKFKSQTKLLKKVPFNLDSPLKDLDKPYLVSSQKSNFRGTPITSCRWELMALPYAQKRKML